MTRSKTMHNHATHGLPRWLGALCGMLMALTLALPASAATEEPDALVKRVSEEVLQILKEHQDNPGGAEVQALVKAKVLGHFDFARMAALAAGLSWRKATPEQKTELTDQFRTLLVRTYASALGKFKGQTLEFDPQRKSEDQRKAIVRSRLLQPGVEAITVDYKMVAAGSGWKVYDVSVDGVSLVTTYRDAFAEEARANGVDGLIRMLTDKNAALASDKAA
jgi:phospholipid transport system substrate-binding protein